MLTFRQVIDFPGDLKLIYRLGDKCFTPKRLGSPMTGEYYLGHNTETVYQAGERDATIRPGHLHVVLLELKKPILTGPLADYEFVESTPQLSYPNPKAGHMFVFINQDGEPGVGPGQTILGNGLAWVLKKKRQLPPRPTETWLKERGLMLVYNEPQLPKAGETFVTFGPASAECDTMTAQTDILENKCESDSTNRRWIVRINNPRPTEEWCKKYGVKVVGDKLIKGPKPGQLVYAASHPGPFEITLDEHDNQWCWFLEKLPPAFPPRPSDEWLNKRGLALVGDAPQTLKAGDYYQSMVIPENVCQATDFDHRRSIHERWVVKYTHPKPTDEWCRANNVRVVGDFRVQGCKPGDWIVDGARELARPYRLTEDIHKRNWHWKLELIQVPPRAPSPLDDLDALVADVREAGQKFDEALSLAADRIRRMKPIVRP